MFATFATFVRPFIRRVEPFIFYLLLCSCYHSVCADALSLANDDDDDDDGFFHTFPLATLFGPRERSVCLRQWWWGRHIEGGKNRLDFYMLKNMLFA